MMTAREREIELARRLLRMAEILCESEALMALESIRQLPREVRKMRQTLFDDDRPRLVGAEAACIVELMSELSASRDEGDGVRESRMVMYLNSFIVFLRQDLQRAERAA